MNRVRFPSSNTIQNHIQNDKSLDPIKVNEIHIDLNGTHTSLRQHLGNAFADQLLDEKAIKSKVEESMTQAVRRTENELDLKLIEAITSSLARLAGLKRENVDMRAA